MKFNLLRLIVLVMLLALVSSCGEGRWRRYGYREHYIHKSRYRKFHEHHNRDW
jgi:hypothetical protein